MEYRPDDFKYPKQIQIAVFYDNEPSTIRPHIEKARSIGIRVMLAETVRELLFFMESYRENAIFFLDMHVPDINDFGQLGFSDIETGAGTSFGTAMLIAYSRLHSQMPLKYAYILSGRVIEQSAHQALSLLENDGWKVDDVKKHDMHKFNSILKCFLADSLEGSSKLRAENEDKVQELDLVVDILRGFGVDDPQQAACLAMGFDKSETKNFTYLKGLAAENLAHGQGDIRMRVDFVVFIKSGISSLLGVDNIPAQQTWMNSKNEALGKRTPLEMICSSDINDIALVAALINRVLS